MIIDYLLYFTAFAIPTYFASGYFMTARKLKKALDDKNEAVKELTDSKRELESAYNTACDRSFPDPSEWLLGDEEAAAQLLPKSGSMEMFNTIREVGVNFPSPIANVNGTRIYLKNDFIKFASNLRTSPQMRIYHKLVEGLSEEISLFEKNDIFQENGDSLTATTGNDYTPMTAEQVNAIPGYNAEYSK